MIQKLFQVLRRDGVWFTLKRAVAWLIAHTPLKNHWSFTFYRGTRLLFTPTLLTYSLFASTHTRAGDNAVFADFISSGDTVLDVGANIGSLTIVAGYLVGPSGTVLAFEPSPRFAAITRRNVMKNGFTDRTAVHEVAVGATSGTTHLNESVKDDTTNHISHTGTAVTEAPLDSFTEAYDMVHFLKIDVEGYNQPVLEGATKTLRKTKVLYTEFRPDDIRRCGGDPSHIMDLMQRYFTLYTWHDHQLTPYHYRPTATTHPDLIGINKEVRPLPQ